MNAENSFVTHQPGQRSLRLVAPQEGSCSPSQPPAQTPPPFLSRLQRDLEAARAEAHNLQELLEELPAILEKKFLLRLQLLQAEQRQLEEENAELQAHLLALLKGPEATWSQPRALPEASPGDLGDSLPPKDSPITRGLGLRRALRLRHL